MNILICLKNGLLLSRINYLQLFGQKDLKVDLAVSITR